MNTTKKSELKGKRFKALRVNKGASIEDIPEMRRILQERVDAVDGAELTETDTAFEINNGQTFLKPKRHKEQMGILDCTKSYAMFNGERIEYTELVNVCPDNWDTKTSEFAIHGTILA